MLDSVAWCSHIDVEALGFITVMIGQSLVLHLRYAGQSRVVHKALNSL